MSKIKEKNEVKKKKLLRDAHAVLTISHRLKCDVGGFPKKKIGDWECNLKHYCSSSTKTTEHNIFSRKKSRHLAEVHAETHLKRRCKYGLQSIWCDWSFSNVKTCAAGPQVCSDWGILTTKKKHVQHQGKKRNKKKKLAERCTCLFDLLPSTTWPRRSVWRTIVTEPRRPGHLVKESKYRRSCCRRTILARLSAQFKQVQHSFSE